MPPGIVCVSLGTVSYLPVLCNFQRTVFMPPGIVRTVLIPPGIVLIFKEQFLYHLVL